jgi:hydrogenase maturation protein HypF
MTVAAAPMVARRVVVRGIVQGVGFRPFVYRLAHVHGVAGWVLNGGQGVEIHVEGSGAGVDAFVESLHSNAPDAAHVTEVHVESARAAGHTEFAIRASSADLQPTAHVSPDLAVCAACLRELLQESDGRRADYPYINCTECGPRYSILLGLPYDRPRTTMAAWPMCVSCEREYHDPEDRRFHAQPTACWTCGPSYVLTGGAALEVRGGNAIAAAARLLGRGAIVAVKGIGGYHLACDAADSEALARLRERKFRKEKPFAVMARDLETARRLATLSAGAEALLTSPARPIVLAPALVTLPGVAPDTSEVGVMLPYTPLHHLIFAAGAPDVIVMTSGNRSSEPIACDDEDARRRLSGIADAFLVGERPIARRVEDSVVRDAPGGPVVLRRSRGYAPAAVAEIPSADPILAVGADLKNTVTLVVDRQAFGSPHLGDLDDHAAACAFDDTLRDMLAVYALTPGDVVVAHDRHPQYVSTGRAHALTGRRHVAVQHHVAHVASVLAERAAFDTRVVGIACDGTGYGDDGAIWGGELFVGSIAGGFVRAAHLREAALAGGDAAARDPVQASAGFLAALGELPPLAEPPFSYPARYARIVRLIERDVRTFRTTSMGRLFDAVAALLGFTRAVTFEGHAAMWLEHLSGGDDGTSELPMPFDGREIDFRPALAAILDGRRRGGDPRVLAAAFHRGLARGLADAAEAMCAAHGINVVVLSGGVFQNRRLLADLTRRLRAARLHVWINQRVPPNDGGISLGQAAIAAFT